MGTGQSDMAGQVSVTQVPRSSYRFGNPGRAQVSAKFLAHCSRSTSLEQFGLAQLVSRDVGDEETQRVAGDVQPQIDR